MNREKRISEAVIRRLPRYYRQLIDMKNRGIVRVSSSELAHEMSLNASQIRQDLNCFGGFGQQGYGYQVEVLLGEIAAILGLDHHYNLIIVGAGNIGSALAGYAGFHKYGIDVIAAFDADAAKVGKSIGGVIVHNISELEDYIAKNDVQIAVLSVPRGIAQETCDKVVAAGVKAVWNFAPVDVESDAAHIENVHLNDSLFVLTYRMKHESE